VTNVKIPVLAAITPLESLRHAEFMANEVPGVEVPPAVIERMKLAEESGRAREEGLAIARELVAELADRVQGLQIAVASGTLETALEVLHQIHA
jgi:5,10-methylenetetrahydrofolate reductase